MSFGKVAAEATEIVPLIIIMTGLALKDQTLIWVGFSIIAFFTVVGAWSRAKDIDIRIHMAFSYMMAGHGSRRWHFILKMVFASLSVPASAITWNAIPFIIGFGALFLQAQVWADAQRIVRGEIDDYWKRQLVESYGDALEEGAQG